MKTVGQFLVAFLAVVVLMLVVMNHAYKIGLRDGRESVPRTPPPASIDKQCMSWWFDGTVSIAEQKRMICKGRKT